jgi:sarcosine oxidase gamma subunit
VLAPTGPLPVEFSDGSVAFRQAVFARPGITVASTGNAVAKAQRDAGASTGFWEMNLPGLAGTPTSPADPAGMDLVAAGEVQKAQASTGCPNPIIALNELLGSDVAGPLPAAAQRYRDAVLGLMRALAADGATPFLLVPRRFTVTGTEDWWRQVGQVGWLVPEAYTPATSLWSIGNPFLISRELRVGFREWVNRLTGLGIPASRVGLMLGFQSGDSQGGRAGLQPTAAWLEIVKLESQAGLIVARELGLSTLWSWGWGTFATAGSADADKQAAACTYLWARDNTLCDAPALGVPGFDPDLTAGTVQLAATTQCSYAGGSFGTAELTALTDAGVSRAGALTALLERSLARAKTTIGPTALLRAERSVIAGQFDGQRGTYRQFLQSEGATPAVARDAIRDQLLESKIARGLHVAPIATADVKAYIKAHAGTRTRSVETLRPVTWLVGQKQGVALPGLAPQAVLAASADTTVLVHAADGPVRVRVLGARVRLPKQPLRQARLAVRALILAESRRTALRDWLAGVEQAAVDTALCQADDVPVTGRSRLLARWPQFRLQF